MHSATMHLFLIVERCVALLVLIAVFPTLLLIALIVWATGGAPVLLTDAASRDSGISTRYRFRTSGRGSAAFRAFGRFLERGGAHELPSLWGAVRGEVPLRYFFRLRAGGSTL